jgi:hypothetical protein
MGLKFRRGTTAQKSGSLAFGEPYVNTDLNTLQIGGATGDILLAAAGTSSVFVGQSVSASSWVSASSLRVTGNAQVDGNLTIGGQVTIGDNTSDSVNVVASLSSSLIPQTDNIFDLGSATKSWRDLYISTGSIKFVANGAVVSTLSANADGSQNFPNGVNITGSLIVSGSNIEFTRDWPEVGTESHFLRLAPFTSSTGRYYDGLGIGIEHLNDGTGTYEHSLQIHSWDNHDNPNYGAELNVGPYRTHMRVNPSGSNASLANISVQEFINDDRTAALIYADSVQIGAVLADVVLIGNTGSVVQISGSTQITSITGSLFGIGDPTSFSTSVNTRLAAAELFSSSLDTTFATDASVTSLSSSVKAVTDTFATSASLASARATDISTISGSVKTVTDALSGRVTTLEGTDISITLTGDVTGTGTITNLANVSFATTIAANSVALGTDTTGDYVASMTAGTGITVGTATGEGSTPVITNTGVTSVSAGTGITLGNTTGACSIAIGQAVATSSNVQFNSLGVGMAASATAGRIDATNDIVAFSSSDIRFKENIKAIENPIEKIRKISGNTYDWKEENKIEHGYEGNDVGVIAQEIEAVLPQLVQTRENGYKAVKYDKLVALLIEGIKAQQNQIDSLTIEIENLKKNNSL